MLEKKQVYYCKTCGNLVEVLWDSKIGITCCSQPMQPLVPNTVDAAKEKHVPVMVREGNQVTVKVGEVAHPMTPEHYILFVELLKGDQVYRHDFKSGDEKAEASFLVEDDGQPLTARAYCNLHGFWSSQ